MQWRVHRGTPLGVVMVRFASGPAQQIAIETGNDKAVRGAILPTPLTCLAPSVRRALAPVRTDGGDTFPQAERLYMYRMRSGNAESPNAQRLEHAFEARLEEAGDDSVPGRGVMLVPRDK